MHIVELRASNFARLRAIAIRPDGSLVKLTGKNSHGKSSVLRAIWTALAGRAAAPPRPIRDGAEEASIQVDLGDAQGATLSVVRTFAHGKHGDVTSALTVTDASGTRGRSPQALLDALLGDLSFDPLAFARLPAKDQFERLKRLVAGIDFDKITVKRRDAYDSRTMYNRMQQTAAARASAIVLPAGAPPAPVDQSALVRELAAATASNSKRALALASVNRDHAEAERLLDEAEALEARARDLKERAHVILQASEDRIRAMPTEIDVGPLTAQLAQANDVLERRRAFEVRAEREKEAAQAKAESDRCTHEIAALDQQVKDAIAAAKLPAGLSLDPGEGAVFLGGLPFAAAGTAEKILASTRVAMALNPKLRVMLIDEGSELDEHNLIMLANLAAEAGYQIWIARVEDGEEGSGFRIEDGEVAVRKSKAAAE